MWSNSVSINEIRRRSISFFRRGLLITFRVPFQSSNQWVHQSQKKALFPWVSHLQNLYQTQKSVSSFRMKNRQLPWVSLFQNLYQRAIGECIRGGKKRHSVRSASRVCVKPNQWHLRSETSNFTPVSPFRICIKLNHERVSESKKAQSPWVSLFPKSVSKPNPVSASRESEESSICWWSSLQNLYQKPSVSILRVQKKASTSLSESVSESIRNR